MAGFYDIEGMLDLATGIVTYEGKQYTRRQWVQFTMSTVLTEHRRLCAERDHTSDIQNLPGIKPLFRDTWFGIVPEVIPPWPV